MPLPAFCAAPVRTVQEQKFRQRRTAFGAEYASGQNKTDINQEQHPGNQSKIPGRDNSGEIMKRRNIKRVVLTVFFMGVMFLYGCSAGNTPEKNGVQAPVPGHASKTEQSVENKAGEDSADKNGKGTTGLQFGEGSENAAKDSGGGLLTDQVDWPEEDRKEMGFRGEKGSGDSEKKEDTAAGGEKEEGKKKKTAADGEKEEGKKKKTAAGGEKEEGKKKKTGDVEEKAQDRQIRLGFAGDLNLSEGWETTVFMDRQENGIRDCFSPALLKEMRDFDLFMLNNEYTYSRRGKPQEKTYTFRADPKRVKNLKTLGVDIVLAANNHIKDYGEESLVDTLDTLDKAGIRRVGAGRNLEEASSPVIYEINGHRIAYVAASCAEEHEDVIWTSPATDDSPGILGCYDPEAFYEAVRKADQQADFVIASVHWGYEYLEYYTEEQEAMARELVASGADAVIGTHPHILQGISIIDGVPVFYSLGNFWFNGEDLMTGMAELTLRLPADPHEKPELTGLRFIPCTQRDLFTSGPEEGQEKELILQHMRDISFGTEIDSDGKIRIP